MDDRLLSAVEFIAQDEADPTAGSPGLRRTVIAQTTAQTADIDFNQAVNPRPVVRAALLSVIICAAAVGLVLLDPGASQTAIARLLNPLGNAAWPQKNHLAIRNPVDRVGRGQAFEVEAVDSADAPLPAEVFIHFRFAGPDRALPEETALMHQVGNTAVARRENITRPFSYRVEGGDDRSMPWLPVEVLQQPAIESLSIRLIPPPYTGWPPEKAENNIRALAGTRLEIEAKATKPLQSAALCLEDGREFPGRLSADGFDIAFSDPALAVEKSGSYWFRLTDREGLQGGQDDRWEIMALADSPPSVTIEQPPANMYVTPQADVPLRIAAKDDLAVRDVTLAFYFTGATAGLPSSASQEMTLPLYTGPQQTAPQTLGSQAQRTPAGQRQVVEYLWHLEPLRLHRHASRFRGRCLRLFAPVRSQRTASVDRCHAARDRRPHRRAANSAFGRTGTSAEDAARLPRANRRRRNPPGRDKTPGPTRSGSAPRRRTRPSPGRRGFDKRRRGNSLARFGHARRPGQQPHRQSGPETAPGILAR